MTSSSSIQSPMPIGPRRHAVCPAPLTVEDVHELRGRVKAWQEAQRLGPKRAHDLVEIIDVMLGTGARIGEVARSALAGHPRSRRRRTCCGDDLWDRRDG